ncbi:MAG: thiamine phosphate synthase [Thermodesulfobacteriota bacterium]|nr:thiamine phosphate synthase [Thermodesulfobacteriota bacterium]
MKIASIDYSLYLVTDRGLSRGRSTLEIVKAGVAGGVTCVQLREKNCSTLEYIHEALSIKQYLKKHNIPLIINDRVDVAQAIGADGVHLGQTDMPLTMARDILQGSMIIGISAESVEDAILAEKGSADYIGVSPIFSTPTKTDTAPPLGLEGLKEISLAVKIPKVAIGGLNRKNAGQVIINGASGIAVVSAIVSAADPRKAAEELSDIIKQARIP